MAKGVIGNAVDGVGTVYDSYLSSLFFDSSLAANVLLLSAALAIGSLFIWKFYKSTSRRNLIKLNLYKYNTSEHPLANKLFAMLFYLIEYIVIMPLLIILWFAGLSIVLMLIATERSPNEILMISAAMIGAIRILAYIKGEIAKDLAKLFPFIALSFFLLEGVSDFRSVFISKVSEIPSLFSNILSFILVVVVIEIILRVFYTIYEFWRSEGGRDEAVQEVLEEKAKEEVKKKIEGD